MDTELLIEIPIGPLQKRECAPAFAVADCSCNCNCNYCDAPVPFVLESLPSFSYFSLLYRKFQVN